MIYLLSEKRLKADFLNDNIASELILPSIQTAQDIYLKQTLGSALYETICELVENNTVVEPYKTLLDDYIIIYLEYIAMAELCVPSTFKLGNIGIAQSYDSNVNSQSIQNVKYLESFYKQKASTYENRLVTYIQQNINYFPEYLATNEVVTAKESTLQTGIFLGGTKTKTSNRTTTNKNSLVGAVRYDKEQNLSEQEKEQARENIGVSANGDIDINLDNYYTKDEVNTLIDNVDVDLSEYYTKDETYNKNQVDTKLAPYITTNEVNLRLNSYYDKNTVNNLLDNLPIPEYTSELIKDDVYTKNEVDEKIANVSSGGSVDLSNYYTKQETYSKEEVNDLVANSGGGSDTPSNMPIVDIMSLTYDEQVELIDFVFDNNRFPDVNTLYTYQGYVLNNLTFDSDLWGGELNYKYITFDLYSHPKSYDIRFITYQWNEGGIYNDITEKGESEILVRKGETYNRQEIENLVANSGGGSSDYNTLENRPTTNIVSWTYEQMNNLYDIAQNYGSLTEQLSFNGLYLNDLEVFCGVGDLNGNDDINRLEFWNRKYGTPYAIRIFIDYVNSMWWWDRNELDETERLLSEYQMQEIYYTKSEIDLQFAEINTTLGDINNILNEI